MKRFGEEVSARLECLPASWKVVDGVPATYACSCDGEAMETLSRQAYGFRNFENYGS
jgi:hypothetical protein